MALVAYDNSDCSDIEEESEILTGNTPGTLDESTAQSENLFNQLPQPSTKKAIIIEEDDEFLHKKETSTVAKPKAKISVPSLSDFKDIESNKSNSKPRQSSEKKSGLLSMLPQPRYMKTSVKSLIPQVLTQKPKPKSVQTAKPTLKSQTSVPTKLAIDYSDDSDEDVQNDFFSMNKPVEFPDLSQEKIQLIETVPAQTARMLPIDPCLPEIESEQLESNSEPTPDLQIPESSSNNVLDDEAILKLCGTRGKRKREDIQIIDINQQEVLANAREMLLKGLMEDTSKRISSSKKRGNEPTNQQKRKHQITYLAHQAKANEAELQKQWANNRMSKRQTQSKYGF